MCGSGRACDPDAARQDLFSADTVICNAVDSLTALDEARTTDFKGRNKHAENWRLTAQASERARDRQQGPAFRSRISDGSQGGRVIVDELGAAALS